MTDDVIPKFKIGDNVFHSHPEQSPTQVQCPSCIGRKQWFVTLPTGEGFNVDCMTCRAGYEGSRGFVSQYKFKPSVQRVTIGSIRIDTNDDDHPVSYMCIETGIGSGSIYYEKDLFLNEFDALQSSEEKVIQRELNQDKDFQKRVGYSRKEHLYVDYKDKRIRALEKEIKILVSKVKEFQDGK